MVVRRHVLPNDGKVAIRKLPNIRTTTQILCLCAICVRIDA